MLNAVDAVVAGKARRTLSARCGLPDIMPRRCAAWASACSTTSRLRRDMRRRSTASRDVLIADWDVHHGNGTQDIFYNDGSVFFFSTHQSPWYPGTGAAWRDGRRRGEGNDDELPFPAGSGRAEIAGAFRERLIEPGDGCFQAGVGADLRGFRFAAGDPLGQFRLTDEDFADLTRMLMDVAEKHAGGSVVSVLEGGYSLDGPSGGCTPLRT